MKTFAIIVLFCALAFGIATVAAMDAQAPPAIIPAPETLYLRWQVLKLRAANLRMQAQSADEAADKVLIEMDKKVGDGYTRFVDQTTGDFMYRLKEVKP